MDRFRFVLNPDAEIIAKINKYKSETFDWNRSDNEYLVWKNGCDEFYLIAVSEKDSDEPIGSISMAKSKALSGNPEDDFYCIGGYFVKEEFRGIGIAKKLMNMVLEYSNGSNVALCARSQLNPLYENKYGFIHFDGIHFTKATMKTEQIHPNPKLDTEGYKIKDISEVDWDKVVAYDREISGRAREKYLRLWLTLPGAITKVAQDPKLDKVVGFACARPQIRNRLVVGPFYAENGVVAKLLAHRLLSFDDLRKYEEVWFRFPPTNEDANPVLDSLCNREYQTISATMIQFNKKYMDYEKKRVFSVMESAHNII